jgi:TetR/AcrR family transcriptional repressor of nem operon
MFNQVQAPANTKATILETARRLFHERGYEATGISLILKEAGVNSGSLYHFFPSKEALLIGVLEYYIQLLMPMVMGPAEEAATDPIERVFALLRFYRKGMEITGCRGGCPIGNLAIEVGDSHPEVRRLIDLNFGNWIARVEGWLVAAGDRLPANVDRHELAKLVLTVMEGAIMQARAASALAAFDASVSQLRVYFDLLEERACAEPAR